MNTNYTTDNRWSPGASGATPPADAPAAYAARWIDCGDHLVADVVPDRQGFAYNDTADRDALMVRMANAGDAIRIPPATRDETSTEVRGDWCIASRRAGGYIYVDAWLQLPLVHKAEPQDESLGVSACRHCGGPVKRVPGGQGPTWIHTETGAVAGKGGAS